MCLLPQVSGVFLHYIMPVKDRAEQQDADEVRDRHQRVAHACRLPQRAHRQIRCQPHGQHVDPKIQPPPPARETAQAAQAVVAPADRRGKGKQCQADKDQAPAQSRRQGQTQRKGLHRGRKPGSGRIRPRYQDGKARERADQKRVKHRARHVHAALLLGIVRAAGCAGNGGGAKPRLVGKHAPADPGLHGCKYPASGRAQPKRTGQDRAQRARQCA